MNSNAVFANSNLNSKATFVMTHFLKLCYNVFILENKIDTPMFKKICVNLCCITLEILLIFINMERFPSSVLINLLINLLLLISTAF
jgi:hypothetical protein